MNTPDFYVPDGLTDDQALIRTTHLGIGAHQDDLEFMAFHGIVECFHSETKWFGGIICTDGAGSSRCGPYADVSNSQMRKVRQREQRLAAAVGRYSFVTQLGYPSKSIAAPIGSQLVNDLRTLIGQSRAQVIYTHNPADKHSTHLSVLVATLEALKAISPEQRPGRLFGCEMWRSLDWLGDAEKTILDLSGHEHLAAALNGIFDSQIAGGKRYDLAVAGRRRANATLMESHVNDTLSDVAFAMDLTPLIGADSRDLTDFTLSALNRFHENVRLKLETALFRS